MPIISKLEKSQVEFLLKNSNDPAIAKQFGITRQAVYNIRKKFNIPSSRSQLPSKQKQIIELRREGASVPKISIIVNKSQSYVYKILRSEARGARINTPDENP